MILSFLSAGASPVPSVLALAWPPWWGIVLAIVVTVIGGIIATSVAGPNLAAVGVTPDDRLLVRPVGLVRLWALSSGVDVPLDHVVDVGVSEKKGLLRGIRAPGTYLPGFMTAGTFRSRGEKDLWMVGRADKVLVIELADEPFRHVIVQVEDPEAGVEALRAAMRRERPS